MSDSVQRLAAAITAATRTCDQTSESDFRPTNVRTDGLTENLQDESDRVHLPERGRVYGGFDSTAGKR